MSMTFKSEATERMLFFFFEECFENLVSDNGTIAKKKILMPLSSSGQLFVQY